MGNFQQDEHHRIRFLIREIVYKTFFSKRLIGERSHSLKAWPPRSSNITPMDFFFWVDVKDIFPEINALKKRIQNAIWPSLEKWWPILGQKSNIVWIFFKPPTAHMLKFIKHIKIVNKSLFIIISCK